jgi:hypothetical protein
MENLRAQVPGLNGSFRGRQDHEKNDPNDYQCNGQGKKTLLQGRGICRIFAAGCFRMVFGHIFHEQKV